MDAKQKHNKLKTVYRARLALAPIESLDEVLHKHLTKCCFGTMTKCLLVFLWWCLLQVAHSNR